MRIFTKEELIGEWSNEVWRFRLYENDTLKLVWLNSKNEANGTFKIFENFLILEYSNSFQKAQWTSRIEDLKNNNLTLTDLTNKVGQLEKMKRTFFDEDLIKRFDFESLEGLTIEEIKKELNVPILNLNSVKNLEGEKTDYFRHWDNDNRFAVVIKNDLLEKVKANKDLVLSLEKNIKMANLGYYTNFLIVEYDDTEYFDSYDERDVYDDYYYDKNNWLEDAAGTNDPETMNDVFWNLD